MEELNIKPCACSSKSKGLEPLGIKPEAETVVEDQEESSLPIKGNALWAAMAAALVFWYAIYPQLLPFSKYAAFDLLV